MRCLWKFVNNCILYCENQLISEFSGFPLKSNYLCIPKRELVLYSYQENSRFGNYLGIYRTIIAVNLR